MYCEIFINTYDYVYHLALLTGLFLVPYLPQASFLQYLPVESDSVLYYEFRYCGISYLNLCLNGVNTNLWFIWRLDTFVQIAPIVFWLFYFQSSLLSQIYHILKKCEVLQAYKIENLDVVISW